MWSLKICSYLSKVLGRTVSLTESLSHRSMYFPTVRFPTSTANPPSRSETAFASFPPTSARVLPYKVPLAPFGRIDRVLGAPAPVLAAVDRPLAVIPLLAHFNTPSTLVNYYCISIQYYLIN